MAQAELLRLIKAAGLELVQLGLQKRHVGQVDPVLDDQCRRQGAAEGILNDFVVLAGAQEHADR